MSGKPGYHGVILDIDLSSEKIEKVALAPEDLDKFVGGRGLGMKILWDRLKKPGVDPLSPDNPLIFMPGPFSGKIGQGSEKFAIHVKGHELAAHNIQANPPRGLSYATANRGGCHLSGSNIAMQNTRAMLDTIGLCYFPALEKEFDEPTLDLLRTITGREYDKTEFMKTGERVFNLEKMFNYREGFRREDDRLPDRFFEDAFTIGPKKGAVLDRAQFDSMLTQFYKDRGWDPETTKPGESKLKELGLDSI